MSTSLITRMGTSLGSSLSLTSKDSQSRQFTTSLSIGSVLLSLRLVMVTILARQV